MDDKIVVLADRRIPASTPQVIDLVGEEKEFAAAFRRIKDRRLREQLLSLVRNIAVLDETMQRT